MNVSSVPGVSTVSPPTGPAPQRAAGDGEVPFSDMMSRFLDQINEPQVQAQQNMEQFMSGETDSVNDVVMSVAKADITFRLFMEIRNRIISSYQEIQRMQV